VEALQRLRGSTPKFSITGKPTVPFLSPRGNTLDTINPPSGIPARIQASVPMSPT
jgi:hypothetical protein